MENSPWKTVHSQCSKNIFLFQEYIGDDLQYNPPPSRGQSYTNQSIARRLVARRTLRSNSSTLLTMVLSTASLFCALFPSLALLQLNPSMAKSQEKHGILNHFAWWNHKKYMVFSTI